MRKIRASLYLMLGIVTFFAFVALAICADSNIPAKKQPGCLPDQFFVWIDTIGTCVPLEFKDKILEPHVKSDNIMKSYDKSDMSGGIFLNISGSSELNKVCLRCHKRVKKRQY